MDYEKRYVKYGGSPNLRFFLGKKIDQSTIIGSLFSKIIHVKFLLKKIMSF